MSKHDESRDHALKPDWRTKHDPLPLPGPEEESIARRMIAANAIQRHHKDDGTGWVSYSRNKNWYADNDRRFYWPRFFSYKWILIAVAQLEGAGLILHDKKPRGNLHWQSRFRATQKLMELKANMAYAPTKRVILRDENKNNIEYNESLFLCSSKLMQSCHILQISGMLSMQPVPRQM